MKRDERDLWNQENLTDEEMRDSYSIHPILRQILQKRGLLDKREIHTYLYGGLSYLHHPAMIPGIQDVADFIRDQLNAETPMAIYCDYDVDGLTGAVLLHKGLGHLAKTPPLIRPSHRFKDGYGLSYPALEELYERGIRLLLTVDCGISNTEEIAWAREKGIEVVVIDHHETSYPPKTRFLDLKVLQGDYPFRELSGAALVWKLLQYILDEPLTQYLDLVALATIADVVVLKDENRILAREGLKALMEGRGNPGLYEILSLKGLKEEEIKAHHIGYQVAPLLNASGRMGSPQMTLDLLLTDSLEKRRELAVTLNQINEKRRSITKKALEEAKRAIDPDHPVILYKGDIPAGIIGLVAGELKEMFNRPAIIIGEDNRGSARSVRPLNMYQLLKDSQESLRTFGGHRMAAGLTLKEGAFQDFQERILYLTADIAFQHREEDLIIEMRDITPQLLKEIRLMEPFGSGNPRPLFRVSHVDVRQVRILSGGHLSLQVEKWRAIGYGMKKLAPLCRRGPVDLFFYPPSGPHGSLTLHDVRPSQ